MTIGPARANGLLNSLIFFQREMQAALSRTWTCVTRSITYDNNAVHFFYFVTLHYFYEVFLQVRSLKSINNECEHKSSCYNSCAGRCIVNLLVPPYLSFGRLVFPHLIPQNYSFPCATAYTCIKTWLVPE